MAAWKNAAKRIIFDRYFQWWISDLVTAGKIWIPGNFQLPLFFASLRTRGFSPKHIVDVGANRWNWTRACLKHFPEADYTLIEPQAQLKSYAHDIIAECGNKIRWINAGVSDKSGILPLTIARRDDSSSFTFTSEAAEARGLRQIEVPVLTLNEIVAASSAPCPEMVKIDAEGFDLRVIAGASELLGKTDIFLLEARLCPPDSETSLDKVMMTMYQSGYHVVDITDLNRLPDNSGALSLCEVAFLRNDSSLMRDID